MWATLKERHNEHKKIVVVPQKEQPFALKTIAKFQRASIALEPEIKGRFNTFVKRKLLCEAPDMTSTITADICDTCGVRMMVIANDSKLACSRCTKTRDITRANAWTMDADFSQTNMHQKSRLIEWLENAQATEFGEISEENLKIVMEALVSARATGLEAHIKAIEEERSKRPFDDVTDAIQRLRPKIPNIETLLKNLDSVAIRNCIRFTKIKRFGEHSAKISSLLTGIWPVRMNTDQEEYVRKLFMTASQIYDRYRRTTQPVWPGGYAYFLRCLMILLGWDEFAALFPIQITGRNQEREEMRKSIWETLQWENVPSCGPLRPIKLQDGTVLNGSIILEADARCKITARGYDEM